MATPPETCPICGADVPARAKACPECGADEKTGWSENSYSNSLDLPDDSFDYDEYVKREFGTKKVLPYGIKWRWWAVALALVILFILGFLGVFR